MMLFQNRTLTEKKQTEDIATLCLVCKDICSDKINDII